MDITWYLVLSALLFAIGAGGVLIRRSPLVILLCLELMLNAGNLALVAFARDARQPGRPGVRADRDGRRRLRGGGRAGLIVAMFRRRLPLNVDEMRDLRG